jgi:hypothetical protein
MKLVNITADMVLLTPAVVQTAAAVAFSGNTLSFMYLAPVVLHTVSPMVAFLRGGLNVSVVGGNMLVYGTDHAPPEAVCVWSLVSLSTSNTGSTAIAEDGSSQVDVYHSTAYVQSASLTLCTTPYVLLAGVYALTLAVNGHVETASSVMVELVHEPVIHALWPSRTVSAHSTVLSITTNHDSSFLRRKADTSHHHTDSHNDSTTVCSFYQGSTVIAYSNAVVSPNAKVLTCPVPVAATSQRHVQRIVLAGNLPVHEVQAVEVTALPNQLEVQRISLSAFGKQAPVWELSILPDIPLAQQAVYTLKTSVTPQAESQRIQLRSPSYILEKQVISLNALVSTMNEQDRLRLDTGVMDLSFGFWTMKVYWNASVLDMKTAIRSLPMVRYVNVRKEISSTSTTSALSSSSSSSPSSLVQVNIQWELEFGYADGNLPQVSILSTSIPRLAPGAVVSMNAKTVSDGLACALQEVVVHTDSLASGWFVLQMGDNITPRVPIHISTSDFRKVLINSFILLNGDVVVTKPDVTIFPTSYPPSYSLPLS